MDRWKAIMAEGNTSYARQSWHEAEQFYYQAVDIVESLWEEDIENIELLLAWIAGMHNLSTLFEKQGLECESLRYLAIPHKRVLKMISQISHDDLFHGELLRTAKVTLLPLLEFSKKNIVCDGCLASLEINKQWLMTPRYQLH